MTHQILLFLHNQDRILTTALWVLLARPVRVLVQIVLGMLTDRAVTVHGSRLQLGIVGGYRGERWKRHGWRTEGRGDDKRGIVIRGMGLEPKWMYIGFAYLTESCRRCSLGRRNGGLLF